MREWDGDRERTSERKLPRILFTPRALARLNAYIELSEGECSGLAKVTALPSGDLLLNEVELLDQESSWGGTTISADAMAAFLSTLVDKGEDVSAWRCWWHSHADFDAYWSSVDERMCAGFFSDWMVSVVANKAGEILGRIDVYKPLHVTSELAVGVYAPLEAGERETLEAEVSEKVKSPVQRGASESGWWARETDGELAWKGETSCDRDRDERNETGSNGKKGGVGWFVIKGRLESFRKLRSSSPSS